MSVTTTTLPTDNSPPVKLHELTPQRLTIKCASLEGCGTLTRVYRSEPAVAVGAFQFCPVCGSDRVIGYMSADLDHWEAMARDYGMSVPAMQAVYAGWNPHEFYRFADYMAALREESRTGVRPPARSYPHRSLAAVRSTPSAPPPLPRLKVPR